MTDVQDPAKLAQELAQARQQLAEMRNMTAAAQIEARQVRRQLSTEQQQRQRAQEAQIDNAITAADTELAALESELVRANEAGDFAAAAAAQRKMATTAAKRDRFAAQKELYAASRAYGDADGGTQSAAHDDLAQYGPPGSPARQWIERNPLFLTDASFKSRVTRGHHKALADGLVEGSPEYFRSVEDFAYDRLAPSQGDAAQQSHPARQGNPAQQEAQDQDDDVAIVKTAASPPPEPEYIQIEETEPVAPRQQTIPAVVPANAQAENPQRRAAGRDGNGIASIAASPSRSRPAAGAGGGNMPRQLTTEQAEFAISLARSIEPSLTSDADRYKWYYDNYMSPGAQKKRNNWANS